MKLINTLRFLASLLLIMFYSTSLRAQDDNTTPYRLGKTSKGGLVVSVSMYNGRFWNALDAEHKDAYVASVLGSLRSCNNAGAR